MWMRPRSVGRRRLGSTGGEDRGAGGDAGGVAVEAAFAPFQGLSPKPEMNSAVTGAGWLDAEGALWRVAVI